MKISIVEQHQQRARAAISTGNLIEAAASLSELARIKGNDPEYLRMAADISLQAGLREQAAEQYLKLAHRYAENSDIAAADNAISHYEKLRPQAEHHRRKLYFLSRANGVSPGEAMALLDEQDRALFALREHTLFQNMDTQTFDTLLSSLQRRCVADGERVIEKGEHADALFIVASGALRPVIEDNDNERYMLALIGEGEVCGETPFLTGQQQRTADVYAAGDTVLYVLPYRELATLVEQAPYFRKQLQQNYRLHAPERQLAMTPFFRHYLEEERRYIAAQMEIVHVAGGETLFSFGDRAPLDIFVVLSGWLGVNTVVNGREHYLCTAKRGHIIGELGLLENMRKYTVRTVSDVTLLRWPEAAVRDYFLQHESFRHQLADRLLKLRENTGGNT